MCFLWVWGLLYLVKSLCLTDCIHYEGRFISSLLLLLFFFTKGRVSLTFLGRAEKGLFYSQLITNEGTSVYTGPQSCPFYADDHTTSD